MLYTRSGHILDSQLWMFLITETINFLYIVSYVFPDHLRPTFKVQREISGGMVNHFITHAKCFTKTFSCNLNMAVYLLYIKNARLLMQLIMKFWELPSLPAQIVAKVWANRNFSQSNKTFFWYFILMNRVLASQYSSTDVRQSLVHPISQHNRFTILDRHFWETHVEAMITNA